MSESPVDNIKAMALEAQVIEAIRSCYDPEIPVNIYELGLIYDVDVDAAGSVKINMTLTSPACPVAGTLPLEVESRVKKVDGVTDAKVEIERGVYVTGVGADSAADRAGLIPSDRNDGGFPFAGGDVITAIDGVEVTSIEELARIVDGHDVGDEVTLSVFRDGLTLELVATLLEWSG